MQAMVNGKEWLNTSFRRVLLDFHNPDFIKGICTRWSARDIIRTVKASNAQSAVFFAKDHYGLSYYNTKIGKRHPGLKFDLLDRIVKESHKAGLKIFAYYSVAFDMNVGSEHPDWLMVDKDGKKMEQQVLGDTKDILYWKRICFNSPYIREILMIQLKEILNGYNVKGLSFDIVVYPVDACYCNYCLNLMKKQNIAPNDFDAHQGFNRQTILNFMRETRLLVNTINPEVAIMHNGIVQNNRGSVKAFKEYVDSFEIECLPYQSGGFVVGSFYLKYLRTIGKPVFADTTRFLKNWGDFGTLKEQEQLKYEVSVIIANGALCSIGDQMNPDGRLERPVWHLIKEVLKFVKEREQWCTGVQFVADIGLLVGGQGISGSTDMLSGVGAMKALMECHHQFDIIDQDEDFLRYRAIIIPDQVDSFLPSTTERLRRFVADGGILMATSYGPFDRNKGCFTISDILGVEYLGESKYSVDYIRITDKQLRGSLQKMDWVVYGRSINVKKKREVRQLAIVVHPVVERSRERFFSHYHAPSGKTDGPAITVNTFGKGKAIYIACPIFKSYFENNNSVYRRIIANTLDMFLPARKRVLICDAPPSVEIIMARRSSKMIVHMVNYHSEKRGIGLEIIERIEPVRNIKISLNIGTAVPSSVSLVPQKKNLKWGRRGRFIEFIVPEISVYQIVIVSLSE